MTAYEKHCREVCPDGCGKGLPVSVIGLKRERGHLLLTRAIPCTAPTLAEFSERQAAQIAALTERAERAEKRLRYVALHTVVAIDGPSGWFLLSTANGDTVSRGATMEAAIDAALAPAQPEGGSK